MIDSIEHIAKAIRKARQKKQLSQRQLSAKTGIPQSHLSKIEQGAVDLQVSSLMEISRVLDLELMLVSRSLVPAVKSLQNLPKQSLNLPAYHLDEDDSHA